MTTDLKIDLKDGKLCIPLDHLFYEAHYLQPDEWDQVDFVNRMGWLPQIREEVIRSLKDEYSGRHLNPDIHKEREDFLVAMERKEIQYYAGVIAGQVEDARRADRDYWKLYHWLHDADIKIPEGFPQREKIDFDYRHELEKVIEDALLTKLPETPENPK